MDVSRQLALVAALVLINAAFAGSEIALISLREGQLRHLEPLVESLGFLGGAANRSRSCSSRAC